MLIARRGETKEEDGELRLLVACKKSGSWATGVIEMIMLMRVRILVQMSINEEEKESGSPAVPRKYFSSFIHDDDLQVTCHDVISISIRGFLLLLPFFSFAWFVPAATTSHHHLLWEKRRKVTIG